MSRSTNGCEQIRLVRATRGHGRDEWRVAQLGRMIALLQRSSAAPDSAGHPRHTGPPASAAAVAASPRAHPRGQSRSTSEPHRVAPAATLQFVLHRRQQVGHLFLINVQLAVAGHPKAPVAQDSRACEKDRRGNGRSTGPETRSPFARRARGSWTRRGSTRGTCTTARRSWDFARPRGNLHHEVE